MLTFVKEKKITIEKVVEKMCHNPAICFRVNKRGFIRENYFADLVLVDISKEIIVKKENLHYKCKWSPLERESLQGEVKHTFVNGNLVYSNGVFDSSIKGMRLEFNR
jgi:dihydroorotase